MLFSFLLFSSSGSLFAHVCARVSLRVSRAVSQPLERLVTLPRMSMPHLIKQDNLYDYLFILLDQINFDLMNFYEKYNINLI